MVRTLRRCFGVALLFVSVAPVFVLGGSLLRAPGTLVHDLDGSAGTAAAAAGSARLRPASAAWQSLGWGRSPFAQGQRMAATEAGLAP